MFSILDTYLDNGLRVLLRRIPNQRTFSCGIWVEQGGKNETSSENGISHLVEHLMFKTNSLNSNIDIEDHLSSLKEYGAKYNASTTKDYTSFYIDGLSRDTEKIIEVLSYLVVNKDIIDPEKFEKEKEVVLQEAEGYFLSSRQIVERLGQALWGDISFGQLVIGKKDLIKNFTVEEVNKLISASYIPENSVLVLAGGFEYDTVLQYIERYFGEWNEKLKKESNFIIQEKPGIYINTNFSGERSTISIGYPTFSFTDFRKKYIDILKDILISPGSRLFKTIREERGMAYNLYSFSTELSKVGNLGLVFSARNANISEIVKLTLLEVDYLVEKGITAQELDKVRKIRETELLYSIESTINQLQVIGKSAIKGKTFSVEENIRDLKRINHEKVNMTIKDVFKNENLSLAILGNVNIDEILPMLDK